MFEKFDKEVFMRSLAASILAVAWAYVAMPFQR